MATPASIVAELRRSTRAAHTRKPDPAPGMTRAQLAARVAELEAQIERAAARANDLGRDLRRLASGTAEAGPLVRVRRAELTDLSARAYAARDMARGEAGGAEDARLFPDDIGSAEPFCACGRRWSQCDRSRARCGEAVKP